MCVCESERMFGGVKIKCFKDDTLSTFLKEKKKKKKMDGSAGNMLVKSWHITEGEMYFAIHTVAIELS